MGDMVYVPVHCDLCKRDSTVPFVRDELEKKLENSDVIDLHCAHDSHR